MLHEYFPRTALRACSPDTLPQGGNRSYDFWVVGEFIRHSFADADPLLMPFGEPLRGHFRVMEILESGSSACSAVLEGSSWPSAGVSLFLRVGVQ